MLREDQIVVLDERPEGARILAHFHEEIPNPKPSEFLKYAERVAHRISDNLHPHDVIYIHTNIQSIAIPKTVYVVVDKVQVTKKWLQKQQQQ